MAATAAQAVVARRGLLATLTARPRPRRPPRRREHLVRRRSRPKLGLDLKGGTQIILEPRPRRASTSRPSSSTRRATSSSSASTPVVSRAPRSPPQGDRNIVVSIPEIPTQEVRGRDQPLLAAAVPPRPRRRAGGTQPTPPARARPARRARRRPEPLAVGHARPPPAAPPRRATAPSRRPSRPPRRPPAQPVRRRARRHPGARQPDGHHAAPTADRPRLGHPELAQQFQALDCSDPAALDGIVDDPAKPLVTCDDDGTAKYILGPVAVSGDKISDATSGYRTNQQGAADQRGRDRADAQRRGRQASTPTSAARWSACPSRRTSSLRRSTPRVIVAPRFNEAILDGRASITGGFTIDEARGLSDQLKFGALPLSFVEQTSIDISPTLGSEQLRYGLDRRHHRPRSSSFVYSMVQYRAARPGHRRLDPRRRLMTYLTHHHPRLVAQLPARHGGRHRSHRGHRLHRRLVHRLLRAHPRRAARRPLPRGRRRDRLEPRQAHHPHRRRRQLPRGDRPLRAGELERARFRVHPRPHDAHRPPHRLLVHPPARARSSRGAEFFRDGHPWSGLDPRRLGAPRTPRYAGRGRFSRRTPRRPPAAASRGAAGRTAGTGGAA